MSYVSQVRPIAQCRSSSGWLLQQAFSDPKPSPTCERKGHVWGDVRRGFHPGVVVRPCTRCAKRGAYVFLTEQTEVQVPA